MDGAVDHILLDEFQDTSPVQWQVLYPFASRAAECDIDSGGSLDEVVIRRSFFCVGDTKQAIYGWRGGVAEIFDAVTDQLPNVESSNQDLSFRSSPVVIDVVNETFANLPRHPLSEAASSSDISDKSMHEARSLVEFSRRFPKHHAAKGELPGYVHLKTSRLVEGCDDATRTTTCFEDAAEAVSELYHADPEISIGILTRTNAGVAQLIFLLERLGVEVSQEGGNPLTDSAAVEMVLSALMMAEHPGDGRWAFHLSASPFRSIDDFGPDMVRSLVEERGLAETVEFLAGNLATACDARDSLRLKQLCHLALSYEDRSATRLRDFVRMVREKRIDRPQAARVRVMTIHQAKGLEFDAVVLAQLDSAMTRGAGNCIADVRSLGEPPHAMSRYLSQEKWHFLPREWQAAFGRQSAANMTEALCLLYVAMTRARHSLLMIIPPAKKREFSTKTPDALLFHALAPESDPTKGMATLFERGDPDWYRRLSESLESPEPSVPTRVRRPVKLLPPPPVPNRNDPRWSNAPFAHLVDCRDQQPGS
jgi:ATP-dependent exoDNAse (exonuclease V) beta subunit